jgi:hypothetical protein
MKIFTRISKHDCAVIVAATDALAAEMAKTYGLIPKRVRANYLTLAHTLSIIRRKFTKYQ